MPTVSPPSGPIAPTPAPEAIGRRPTIPAVAAAVQRTEGPNAIGSTRRWGPSSTPGWYRMMTTVAVATIVAFAAVATPAAFVVRGSSATIENNTAPSLVATQDLLAGVAEANAAATAVFLSGATGEEDRGRRNLYLDALRRASEQTEEVAGRVGDDDVSHAALKDVAVALTTYSGEIEVSRSANLLDLPEGATSLRRAVDLTQNEIAPAVGTVTARSQDQFDRESTTGRLLSAIAIALGLLGIVVLVWLQLGTAKRSKRLFNLPLLVATIALTAAVILLSRGLLVRATALDNAERGGYDSIVTTSELQAEAFQLQSELSLLLIGTGGTDVTELIASIDADVATIGANADSRREQAAAEQLAGRWERYRATAEQISTRAGGDPEGAIATFQGSGVSTFNGLNTSIDSVLFDNRNQFLNGVEGASDAVSLLPLVAIILPIIAALATAVGVQRRLEEYQ